MKENLTAFLRYWRKPNYAKAYRLCQKTWQFNNNKAKLQRMLEIPLEDFRIEDIKQNQNLATASVALKIAGAWKATEINLIRETAPYKPSETGEWGVNPISILRIK